MKISSMLSSKKSYNSPPDSVKSNENVYYMCDSTCDDLDLKLRGKHSLTDLKNVPQSASPNRSFKSERNMNSTERTLKFTENDISNWAEIYTNSYQLM